MPSSESETTSLRALHSRNPEDIGYGTFWAAENELENESLTGGPRNTIDEKTLTRNSPLSELSEGYREERERFRDDHSTPSKEGLLMHSDGHIFDYSRGGEYRTGMRWVADSPPNHVQNMGPQQGGPLSVNPSTVDSRGPVYRNPNAFRARVKEFIKAWSGPPIVGALAGATVGAFAGAALGSIIFPGAGTAVGAVVGTYVGGWLGASAGIRARAAREAFRQRSGAHYTAYFDSNNLRKTYQSDSVGLGSHISESMQTTRRDFQAASTQAPWRIQQSAMENNVRAAAAAMRTGAVSNNIRSSNAAPREKRPLPLPPTGQNQNSRPRSR